MKKYLITIAIMSLFVITAEAQQQWTFSDCVDYARQHNISLQKSRLSEQSAAYDLEAAKGEIVSVYQIIIFYCMPTAWSNLTNSISLFCRLYFRTYICICLTTSP